VIAAYRRGQAPLGEFYLKGEITTDFAYRASKGLAVEQQNDIVRRIRHTRKANRTTLLAKLVREALAAKRNSQPGSATSS
jgi:hypothetical protein